MARGVFAGTQRFAVPLPVPNLTTFSLHYLVMIASSQSANNRAFMLGDGTHGVGMGFQGAGTTLQVVDEGIAWRGAGVVLTQSIWYAIGLARSGGGVWQVFVNGTNTENPTAAPAALTGQLTLGNSISATNSMNGWLGPFSVWNAALTANDFLQLARGTPPMSVQPTALRAHIPMFGSSGAGGNENDWSPNQFHGIQTGNPGVINNSNVGRPLVTL
jgi:hypothetical protein